MYKNCNLCPRNCGVDRLAGETGFCGETAALRIGFAGIHKGEEPPLVGTGGSGTVFISGCNLGCSFCQNWQISQGEGQSLTTGFASNQASSVPKTALGKPVSSQEFIRICAELKEKGAENINIVTGSHAIPALAECFATEEFQALSQSSALMPVVWNSSGYENPEALSLLKDYVDIYLPDLKTLDSEIAAKYFNAPDYPQTAAAAILKMIEMSETNGNSRKKVIIRHLILPGCLDSTRSVLRWFAENAAGKAQLSILTQYTPIPNRNRPMPDRFITQEEYNAVLNYLEDFSINDGFCQELVTGNEWLPDFNRVNPFSSELSVPVWQFS